MEQALHPYYPLIVLMPLLLSGLAFFKYHKYKKLEFRHLSEFYLSMIVVVTSSWFLLPLGSAYVILSMLPWMWTLRTLGQICEDITNELLFSKYHLYGLALGGIVSIVFLSFDFTLSMVAAPFALSIGFTGFTFILQSYTRGKVKYYDYLTHFNLLIIFSFFLSRLFFPLLISHPENIRIASHIDLYLMVTFCASLYPLYAEIVFEGYERVLEKVLAARNKQLLSHSGFSEYKILSAGLSHEVNNALTIINAKISQMMRRKSLDPEKDLQIIQNAANRIINSIRGLREFIYPHEVQEVLDLDEIVNEVLNLYGQRLINHGVQVNLSTLNGKLVKGKKVLLEQVFLSLINNSVDSIDELEEKWINITAKGAAGDVKITYQDSGPSKDSLVTPLLSDPFNSYNELMDYDIRLVQAKEIIENHGGTLNCAHHNEYSTFVITLPLADALASTSSHLQDRIEEIKDLH